MRRPLVYVLQGHEPVPEFDVVAWALWFGEAHRLGTSRVAETTVGAYWVSTAFLGVDFNAHFKGPPVLFETMVFKDDEPQGIRERYSTWDEAEQGHARVVALVQEAAGG